MALDKLVDSIALDNGLESIADAIRAKGGTSASLAFPSEFITAIENIPSGGGTDVEDGITMRTVRNYTNSRVSMIASCAFYSYSSLNTVSFPACTSLGGYAFCGCTSLVSADLPRVLRIGSSAFDNCGITEAIFPDCETICYQAFGACKSLSVISMPNCKYIGSFAFYDCGAIEEAVFPLCSFIGSSAFKDCTSLTALTLPACKSIYSRAFGGCVLLVSLYLLSNSLCTIMYSNTFSSTPIGGYSTVAGQYGNIFVPLSLVDAYKAASNWSYFASRIVGI